jgi:hypothetical protein
MNLDEEDPDPLVGGYEEIEDINLETKKEIDKLKLLIGDFKKSLFYTYVSNDTSHKANNIGSMMSYHALFLQCVAFWIGLLDNQIVSKPEFQDKKLQTDFKTLSKIIYQTAMLNSDSRTLVYSLLLQVSTQYPYDLENVSVE